MDRTTADTIATDAWIYLYPLVTMELTRLQSTNVEPDTVPFKGPMNTFVHVQEFPAADFKMVVRPNFDTLYSAAFLDLTDGPMVVSAPDTDDRYYMLPMLDMWSDVFAVPGKRTTGTGALDLVVVGPGWNGASPEGLDRIDAPTPYVWLIGRTQTNGPADYDAVHAVQAGMHLQPLSTWGSTPAPVTASIDPDVDMTTPPLDAVNAMTGADYFRLAAQLLQLHPPHVTDWSVLARMASLGLVPGQPFDPSGLDPVVTAAIEAAPANGLARLAARLPTMATVTNGWQMNIDTMGVYGNFYEKRAIVAMVGLGANPPEDAVYPLLQTDADGNTPDGSTDYVLHFDASELPPVDAFWSVTMYDAHGFQVANELDRFAIGDRDPLVYGADGSLDIYVQHAAPSQDRLPNWLPAPTGPLGITMRLYAPGASVLAGTWAPPPLRRAEVG